MLQQPLPLLLSMASPCSAQLCRLSGGKCQEAVWLRGGSLEGGSLEAAFWRRYVLAEHEEYGKLLYVQDLGELQAENLAADGTVPVMT